MSKIHLLVALVASLLAGLVPPAPAQAVTIITYVSPTGSDSHDCSSPSQACATFTWAMVNTSDNGTVVCQGFPVPEGPITISKSITISCTPGSAPLTGITINVSAGYVRLRNVHLNGLRSFVNGINIAASAMVIIEDCVIENFAGFGISNNHTGGGTLLISNTTIQNNNTGVGLFGGSGDSEIDNSRVDNNLNGIGVANTARVVVTRSRMVRNVTGLILDPGGIAVVDGSTISTNNTGITAPNGSTVVLSNNNIFLNSTAFSGTTLSYRSNQVQQGGLGTPPIAMGSAQSPAGTM